MTFSPRKINMGVGYDFDEASQRWVEVSRHERLARILVLIRKLYNTDDGITGCCLHIVLDDGNIEYGNLQFCYGYASAKNHQACIDLVMELSKLTEFELEELYEHPLKRVPLKS